MHFANKNGLKSLKYDLKLLVLHRNNTFKTKKLEFFALKKFFPVFYASDSTMPPPIFRQTLGSIPENVAEISDPPLTRSGTKPKNDTVSSNSVIESSVSYGHLKIV